MANLPSSTYYDWVAKGKPIRTRVDEIFMKQVKDSFIKTGRKTFGYRRITIDLNEQGIKCSGKKVIRYMHMQNLRPNNWLKKRSPKLIPERNGKYPRLIYPKMNLDQFGMVLSLDITEGTINNIKYYICGFKEIKTNKLYGMTIKSNKGNDLVIESFQRMVDEVGVIPNNSILHTDNGSEFKSYQFKLATMAHNMKISMSRIGRSTDNGWIEGIWSILKREAIPENKFWLQTLKDIEYNFVQYKNYYNNDRITLSRVKL